MSRFIPRGALGLPALLIALGTSAAVAVPAQAAGSWSPPVQLPGSCGGAVAGNAAGAQAAAGYGPNRVPARTPAPGPTPSPPGPPRPGGNPAAAGPPGRPAVRRREDGAGTPPPL